MGLNVNMFLLNIIFKQSAGIVKILGLPHAMLEKRYKTSQ